MKTIFKHTLLSLAILAGAFTAQAQVKIGDSPTTINAGSVLELQSTDKGLLMPRINLINTTTWGLAGTPAAGMHVYNTNMGITSTNTAYPTLAAKIGLYYWDGTGWVALTPLVGTSRLIYAGSQPAPVFFPNGSSPTNQVTTPSYDPYAGYSGGVFTIPFAGWYVITNRWQQVPTTWSNAFYGSIYINNELLENDGRDNWDPCCYFPGSNTASVYLNTGDKVKFEVNFCSGCTAGYTMKNVYQTISTLK